ncbi:MAG: DNA primase [Parvularculales bacterium]
MVFSDSFLEAVRMRISLRDVVGQRVQWDRVKSNPTRRDWWACCPFHQEKTPSFHVDENRNRYHCFGCGASGDVVRFVMETENLRFPEAVERLASEAGIKLPIFDPQQAAREKHRAGLYEIIGVAQDFFRHQLTTPAGVQARAWLEGRRVTASMQEAFAVGYAPGGRDGLICALQKRGIGTAQMLEAGLTLVSQGGEVRDRFRHRIMFPIHDDGGRVIAFGGRALDETAPAKYLNSPETPTFQKRAVLYNFHNARRLALKVGTVIMVEGYMDAVAMAGAGFGHVVAPLGTALGERQIELMWRLAPEPIICFDGDVAGMRAAWRAMDIILPLLQPGQSVRFAMLPEGEDPDDVLRLQGRAAMQTILAQAQSLSDALWERESVGGSWDTPERRAQLESRLEELVNQIQDTKVRAHYQSMMRERCYQLFRGATLKGRTYRGGEGSFDRNRVGHNTMAPRPETRRNKLAQDVLYPGARLESLMVLMMLNHPMLLGDYGEDFGQILLQKPWLNDLKTAIMEVAAQNDPLDREALERHLSGQNLMGYVESLRTDRALQNEPFAGLDSDQVTASEGWRHIWERYKRIVLLPEALQEAGRRLVEQQEEGDSEFANIGEIINQIGGHKGSETRWDDLESSSEIVQAKGIAEIK